jgi:hypothetical protein
MVDSSNFDKCYNATNGGSHWTAAQADPNLWAGYLNLVQPAQGRPECHDWLCDLNNAAGTAGDLGRDAGGGLGNLYSGTLGGLVNNGATIAHDTVGVQFDAVVGGCAGFSVAFFDYFQAGGQLCVVASTDSQLGVAVVPAGSGQFFGAEGGPTAGFLFTNNTGRIGDLQGAARVLNAKVKTPWGGAYIERDDTTGNLCHQPLVTWQLGPAGGAGGGAGAGKSWTQVLWQNKEDRPC